MILDPCIGIDGSGGSCFIILSKLASLQFILKHSGIYKVHQIRNLITYQSLEVFNVNMLRKFIIGRMSTVGK